MTGALPSTVISGDEALAAFRQGLTGPYALDLLLQAKGTLLAQMPVGTGKSTWMIEIVATAAASGEYDLILILVPRRDILAELRQRLPADLQPVVLSARPRRRCGDRDADWVNFELCGCALLARQELCDGCPTQTGCRWPRQYSWLRGARLILATQANLAVNAQFIHQVRYLVGAQRPLVLIDESDLLVRSTERSITRAELEYFQDTLEAAALAPRQRRKPGALAAWVEATDLLLRASTEDLQAPGWSFPAVGPKWAVTVQRAGRDLHGSDFRFLAFDLLSFADSDRWSRERLPNGGLRFAVPPALGKEFMIFSSSIAPSLARYRLDPNHRYPALLSPFQDLRFDHPGTRWFNIANVMGAASYFPRHADAIFDFFTALIARNIQAGKRTLLICRKKFRALCTKGVRKRLKELGIGAIRIVTGGWARQNLNDPRTLPLISYGISGVNRFEEFEAAYCLTGYYVHAAAVEQAVHDLDVSTDRYPVTLQTEGNPPRRYARVAMPANQETIIPRIAQLVLDQKEADVVVQAVGRVRPFTRPREVITFQAGALPGVQYTREFRALAEARSFFGTQTRKQAEIAAATTRARQLRALRWSHNQIAQALGISPSTVKRYLRRGEGPKG